ncbi:HdeD family acid-resistance protein [Shimia ponticola]|uniref:HdeD family acid-resistance protein n=1 Tax=Shimia ponticola TaxID=2582893 RepID=UPI0011BDE574|nr:DUF308 domain-containing protein [Shimia ponticola]
MTSPRLMLISGVFLIVGGFVALLAPLAASLAATLSVGWFFLIQGGVGLWAAFQDATDRWWQLAMGVLGIVLGLSFIINPVGGIVSLTLFVGAVLMASGGTRLWMAYRGSFGVPRWVLILSGFASLLLGLFMAFGAFGAGAVILGIVIAFEMVSMGAALVAMGWRGKAPSASSSDTSDAPAVMPGSDHSAAGTPRHA